MQQLLARLAAAVLVAAAAAVALPATPARAAYCSTANGVSVLVDYGDLGGGTATGCGTGSTASKAFESAGAHLTEDSEQATFVCKVEGKPSTGDCMATDAYWAFFVSDDGKPWRYASLGVYSQPVDAGDSVALVWQSSSKSRRTPGQGPAAAPTAAPTTKAPTKAPTGVPGSGRSTRTAHAKPTRNPRPSAAASATAAPTTVPTTTSATTSPATTPSATTSTSAAPTPGASESATQSSSVAPSATDAATPSSDLTAGPRTDATEPVASDSGGLPGWVPPVLVALLAVAAGGVAWVRRAR